MNLPSLWKEEYSRTWKKSYYYNTQTKETLWKVENDNSGWGWCLHDNKQPNLGKRYINIITGERVDSESKFNEEIRVPSTNEIGHINHRGEKRSFTSISSSQITNDSFSSLNNKETVTSARPPSTTPADFYSGKRDTDLSERKQSRILHLRNLNNWVKTVLINEFCPMNARVLDLASGKGGDLKKWRERSIKQYVGVDIASQSVKDALHRFKSDSSYSFPARFAIADLGKHSLSSFLQYGEHFDIVSCQFAMHYLFKSEARIRTFFQTLSRSVCMNGVYIATIADCNAIVRVLRGLAYREEGTYVWRNSICSIVMDESNYERIDRMAQDPYGIEYLFTLVESVGDVPEYLAPFPLIKKLAQEYGFEVIKKMNFQEFIRSYMQGKNALLSTMQVMNCRGEISRDQMEVAQLYCVLVLKKVEEGEEGGDYYEQEEEQLGKTTNEIQEEDIVDLTRES